MHNSSSYKYFHHKNTGNFPKITYHIHVYEKKQLSQHIEHFMSKIILIAVSTVTLAEAFIFNHFRFQTTNIDNKYSEFKICECRRSIYSNIQIQQKTIKRKQTQQQQCAVLRCSYSFDWQMHTIERKKISNTNTPEVLFTNHDYIMQLKIIEVLNYLECLL